MNYYRRRITSPSGHPSAVQNNKWKYAEYEVPGISTTNLTIAEACNDLCSFYHLQKYNKDKYVFEQIPLYIKFKWISVYLLQKENYQAIKLAINALTEGSNFTSAINNYLVAIAAPGYNKFASVKLSWPFPYNQHVYTSDQTDHIATITTVKDAHFLMRLGVVWKPRHDVSALIRQVFPQRRRLRRIRSAQDSSSSESMSSFELLEPIHRTHKMCIRD